MEKALWQKVYSELRSKIEKGYFEKKKFPTLREICEIYGVSEITARRATAELAAIGAIRRSTKTGSSVIRTGSVKEIFLADPFGCAKQSIIYSQISQGIIEEAAQKDIIIRTVSPDFILKSLDTLSELNLIAPATEEKLFEKLISCGPAKKRIVKYHSMTADRNFSTVRADLKAAALLAMRHLLDKGHKRIAFITGEGGIWFASRFETYAKSLSEAGIGPAPELIKGVEKGNYEETEEAMKSLMKLKDPPDAVFAATDIHALNILEFCKKNRIKIPQKLAVCGFDNLPESEFYSPPLTTVDTRWKEQGKEAVRLFESEEFLNGKIIDIKIKPELITRKSS